MTTETTQTTFTARLLYLLRCFHDDTIPVTSGGSKSRDRRRTDVLVQLLEQTTGDERAHLLWASHTLGIALYDAASIIQTGEHIPSLASPRMPRGRYLPAKEEAIS